MDRCRMEILYSGRVQGVGFRYTVKSLACGYDISGTVRNLPDGRVHLVVEGARTELEEFRAAIRQSEVGRFIRGEAESWLEARNDVRGFEIAR